MSLRDYSLIELAAEIRRRQMDDEPPRERLWCSECIHFKPWTGANDAPADWNGCGMGHKMTFQCPPWDVDGSHTGFHRPRCKDRVQMTEEEMQAESKRILERYAWQFRHLPQAAKTIAK